MCTHVLQQEALLVLRAATFVSVGCHRSWPKDLYKCSTLPSGLSSFIIYWFLAAECMLKATGGCFCNIQTRIQLLFSFLRKNSWRQWRSAAWDLKQITCRNRLSPHSRSNFRFSDSSQAVDTSHSGITFIGGEASQSCQIREWERKHVSILSATRTRQGRNNSRASGKVTDKWNGSPDWNVFLTSNKKSLNFFIEVSKWVCKLVVSCDRNSEVFQAEQIWLVRTDKTPAVELTVV